MALQFVYPYTDTSSTVTKSLPLDSLTWATDWYVDAARSGKEFTLIGNTTSAEPFTASVRFSHQEITDVYHTIADDKIIRPYQAPSKRGVRFATSYREIPYVTDDSDPTFRQAVPSDCAITCRVPYSEWVTKAYLKHLVARTVSTLFETIDSTPDDMLWALFRGRNKPSDL